jgi:aromatic-L-amino-acid decarboxylase
MADATIATLRRALEHAERYVAGLDREPVGATVDVATVRARLALQLEEKGLDPRRVIDELVGAADGGLLRSSGGRFFAWVIGGALPSALAADWLTSTWDQNAVLHCCSPAAAVAEEVAGEWLKELLHLPRDASFAFTTGCQMAHFVGLAAARQVLLGRLGWDVEQHGLRGAPQLRILVGELRHGSVDRALKFLGLGRSDVELLPVDAQGRVRAASLAQALGRSEAPAIVVLGAGEINTGALDPFSELIPLARERRAWVHVDGAFGLIARASDACRPLLAGLEQADSWASDAHKWLNVPFDCGLAFVRDRGAHRAAMTIRADYVQAREGVREPIDWTPEWSRRARGFAVYAALRELGRRGLAELVDRCCEHVGRLVDGLGALPGVQVLCRPSLNQGLVRFLDPRPGASEADHDRFTAAVLARIQASGEALFSATVWQRRSAMRVSVVNWRTSRRDVERSLAACASALDGARARAPASSAPPHLPHEIPT